MKMFSFLLLFLLHFATNLCFAQTKNDEVTDYISNLKLVTDVMVNDATSPVAAARYYSYITLAANEMLDDKKNNGFSFQKKIKDFSLHIPDSLSQLKIDKNFACLYSLVWMGQQLLPSGNLLLPHLDSLKASFIKKGGNKKILSNTLQYVTFVGISILNYSTGDFFKGFSGMPKYTPKTGAGYWQPTPPIFMAPIEPYWWKLRTFALDSSNQFKSVPTIQFDTAKNSLFYKLVLEVYNTGNNLSPEQQDIANFWDCNPYAVQQFGHVEFALKKISPGGHWIGIAGIACKKNKLSLKQTAWVHALVSMGLSDAFVSCWKNKYTYNRIRPETYINRYIDKSWHPWLQTPPFPEYSSGHAVISTTSSEILTALFGNNFAFNDTSEKEFGLPARRFKSFKEAANEATISRLYGGLHFRDALENSKKEGSAIGRYIIHKLNIQLLK